MSIRSFPDKERFALSLLLNNLIASPSFQSWVSGQPLDIPGFLATPNGKPRHSIFYIAHLNDAERMFFITLLLNQVITWMRKQSGTTSLRALLYMDEIFGFFPPVSNPPSKQPMLTLLKQARAFGLGVLLTTQNPVDLDYKGLTNAGTWFVGRLQAERDKERLLDGLESAASASGQTLKRQELDQLISGLSNRVFLLHNVNDEASVVFQTRWAMCYLRGPLTKPQVKTLMGDRQPDVVTAAPNPLIATQPTAPVPPTSPGESGPPAGQGFRQVYLPLAIGAVAGAGSVQYRPALLGQARLHFVDAKRQLDQWQDLRLLLPIDQTTLTPQWEQAQPVAVSWRDQPEPSATFAPLPATINEAKDLQSLARQLEDFLYRTRRITLLFSAAFKAYSQPDESERDFRSAFEPAGSGETGSGGGHAPEQIPKEAGCAGAAKAESGSDCGQGGVRSEISQPGSLGLRGRIPAGGLSRAAFHAFGFHHHEQGPAELCCQDRCGAGQGRIGKHPAGNHPAGK